MNNIIITGVAGFIGSNLARELRRRFPNATITGIDRFNYAAHVENINKIKSFDVYNYDLSDQFVYARESNTFDFLSKAEYIFHLAASSHVDKSIEGPEVFVKDNVQGTFKLLEFLRTHNTVLKNFVHVSTDEVYGDLPLTSNDAFTEHSPIRPSSPYSSTKASSDLIALSYGKTFGMPIVVTRCSNNYGPRQDPTKLIPKLLQCIRNDTEFTLYNQGQNMRDWLFVYDHVDGLIKVANVKNNVGNTLFNFGTGVAVTNQVIIEMVQRITGEKIKIKHVEDRLAHDRMYRVDSKDAQNRLGWKPTLDLETGLAKTISWYADNNWRLKEI